jgi:hypothetical protein
MDLYSGNSPAKKSSSFPAEAEGPIANSPFQFIVLCGNFSLDHLPVFYDPMSDVYHR